MNVVLDDLAADGGRRVLGRPALGIGVPDSGRTRARNQRWLILGMSDRFSLVHRGRIP
jgi:hypothetical protein